MWYKLYEGGWLEQSCKLLRCRYGWKLKLREKICHSIQNRPNFYTVNLTITSLPEGILTATPRLRACSLARATFCNTRRSMSDSCSKVVSPTVMVRPATFVHWHVPCVQTPSKTSYCTVYSLTFPGWLEITYDVLIYCEMLHVCNINITRNFEFVPHLPI